VRAFRTTANRDVQATAAKVGVPPGVQSWGRRVINETTGWVKEASEAQKKLTQFASELADAEIIAMLSKLQVSAEQVQKFFNDHPTPWPTPTPLPTEARLCAELSQLIYDMNPPVGASFTLSEGHAATIVASFTRKDQLSWVVSLPYCRALIIVFRGTTLSWGNISSNVDIVTESLVLNGVECGTKIVNLFKTY
jgi:hypothetical protein